MSELRTITKRQALVLRFICSCELPPTFREIGLRIGSTSTNGPRDHLLALERKGFIRRSPDIARGIYVTEAGRRAIGLPTNEETRLETPDNAPSHPILHELLGPQLDAMERVLALGRAGKYSNDTVTEHGPDHHFAKADSHQARFGAHYADRDHESGERHIIHSALRLLMTDACVQADERHLDTSEAPA